jgi:hypothetical protein
MGRPFIAQSVGYRPIAMASSAFDALSNRLADIDQLMAAHAAVGGNQRGRRFEVEALNRASVLLLSAHLGGISRRAALGGGLGRAHRPNCWRSHEALRQPDNGKCRGPLRLPRPQQALRLDLLAPRRHAAVKKNINELVATRNAIAHGTTGVTVHKSTVTRYRRYVVGFAKGFDNLIRDRVSTLTGTSPWTVA